MKSTGQYGMCDYLDQSALEILVIFILVIVSVSILLFHKRISRRIMDIMTGGDSSQYEGKTVDELIENIDNRLREVVG